MVQSPKGAKRTKKSKRPDTRPAKKRYWTSGRLAYRKVRNLVRSGYSAKAALILWESTRKRNKGEIPYEKIARLDN